MRILSLFDGISCARIALDQLNIPVEKYYSSEIDEYALAISKGNWDDIKQLGDITKLYIEKYNTYNVFKSCERDKNGLLVNNDYNFIDIDLIIGGSPCQDLSIAKNNRKGLKGSRSNLFGIK